MSLPRPDSDALRYARDWEPILAAPAHRVLDRLGPEPASFLDLGAGTGSLSLAAATRWPAARIVALDASAGMLSVARQRAHDEGHDPARFEWHTADAASMPVADRSVAAVGSSFVLQLVDDRAAVFAEVLRVLEPGGRLSFVTWLADELELPADEAFLDVIEELGLDDTEAADERPPLDFTSLEEAHRALVDAGFADVAVEADTLHFGWTVNAYLEWKERYDERALFEDLDEAGRVVLREALRRRMASVPADDFELRGTLVAAVARRPRSA